MTGGSLPLFRQTVRAEWIDYNGHMSEAFYVLVFGHATDTMMDAVGLDPAYRESSGCSLYTVEAHVRYLKEVPEGTPLAVRTRILGVDGKKLRFAHEMYAGEAADGREEGQDPAGQDEGAEAVATIELFALHVGAQGSAPFPEPVRERLTALLEEPPAWAGRAIGPVPRAA
ncbi:thioesterase family protein [Streptomyces tubbatahanensis]|uniref:Thioesterase family protein n=1 Tax=Streptomyces tubbatahanensis TaxID=2923272 RepID=A0ABY3XVG6_9ACTN|nr:thioesterase family protein [Streptomyces tubbatahanensis]UNS98330.1 thioesterase family protein [Streptomyces tubbatahanensis]